MPRPHDAPGTRFHPCPKCNRRLRQAGEITLGLPPEDSTLDGNAWWDAVAIAATYPLFTCPECFAPDSGTSPDHPDHPDHPLTFALDPHNTPFHPSHPDSPLTF